MFESKSRLPHLKLWAHELQQYTRDRTAEQGLTTRAGYVKTVRLFICVWKKSVHFRTERYTTRLIWACVHVLCKKSTCRVEPPRAFFRTSTGVTISERPAAGPRICIRAACHNRLSLLSCYASTRAWASRHPRGASRHVGSNDVDKKTHGCLVRNHQ